ncbi:uncharacterized protein LOC101243424 isoform X1 [Ciona intestinalis]
METKQDGSASEDRDGSRSRGRKRTAREIAKMFEQLKERHILRKREWKTEKEELLRQAAVAADSKRILLDLKKVLEGLRIELKEEERKRKEGSEIHQEEKRGWDEERTNLLDLIHELEKSNQRKPTNPQPSNRSEVDSLKRRLEVSDRDLNFMKKMNSEIEDENSKLKREFESERIKLIKKHDDEEKKWSALKQQLLEKIQYLEEINMTPFPLHGSHVTSSCSDERRHQTSLETMKPEVSMESKRIPPVLTTDATASANITTETCNYEQFHNTVDAALKQIEKISEDLDNINIEPTNLRANDVISPEVETRNTSSLSSHLIAHPTMPRLADDIPQQDANFVSAEKATDFVAETNEKRKRSRSFCTRTNEEPATVEPMQRRSSLSHFSSSSLSPTKTNSPDSRGRHSNSNRQHSISPARTTPTSTAGSNRSFAKVEKHYVAGRPTHSSVTSFSPNPAKKLPNLHQQLLFFGGKPERVSSVSPRPNYTQSTKSSSPTKLKLTKENSSGTLVGSPDSSSSTQPVELVSVSPVRTTDSGVTTPLKVRFSSIDEDVSSVPPPVAPKPTVTIEKDASGALLLVVPEERPKSEATSEKSLNVAEDRDRNFVSRQNGSAHKTGIPAPVTDKSSNSLGKMGKTWFKKHLNFRDAKTDEVKIPKEQANSNPNPKSSKKTRLKHYTKKETKSKSNVGISSSSDESDVTRTKGKSRRHSRVSNEDRRGSSEMKTVLSRFKASNFNPKKPAVVKQFEKKLLENEVRMLKEPSKKVQAPSSAKMIRKKWNLDTFEDGYSGEDELDDKERLSRENSIESPTATSFVSFRRAPPNTSSQNFRGSNKTIRPKPTYRRSMTDLSMQSDFVPSPSSNWTRSDPKATSAFHKVTPRSNSDASTKKSAISATWKQKILKEIPEPTVPITTLDQTKSTGAKINSASKEEETKQIIEKCKKLRPKPKRYSRSETLPLTANPAVIKDIERFWANKNSVQNEDDKAERRRSMPPAVNENSEPTIPALTSRFKKPSLKNRRVPSRWKKEENS